MYLLCLTGTLLVVAEYFERWQQPLIYEAPAFSREAVTQAVADGARRLNAPAESVWAVFPTEFLPRGHIAVVGNNGGEQEWWFDSDGNLGEPPAEGLAHLLRELHYYLLLPHTWGMVLVSALGAMLVALILTGILAHPKILRDAFHLRLGRGRRLEQIDIHNRLSVWGLPFHLAIAITGAFFGLVGPLVLIAASAFYDGDPETVYADVYGDDPVLEATVQAPGIDSALDWMATELPEGDILYLVVHHPGQRSQFIEIAAELPGRLAYSEIYRFASDGQFIGSQGLTDGPTGRQVLYSVYRLHFGHFGGLPVRIAYLLLGLALTVVSVSGINVWLAKRGGRSRVNDLWSGVVWGTPFALAVAAGISLLAAKATIGAYVLASILAIVLAVRTADETTARLRLQFLTGATLLAIVTGYMWVYPMDKLPAAVLTLNATMLLLAMWWLRPLQWASRRTRGNTACIGKKSF